MKIFYSDEFLKYREAGHPEAPERLRAVVEYLKRKGIGQFEEPESCAEDLILLGHSPDLIAMVKSEQFFDPDTPCLPNIYHFAALACGAGVQAMEAALADGVSFSLARPPGHHAGRKTLGGFCYLNNMAVAALQARQLGKKVAVLDLDGHHGNGTEEILRGKEGLIYLSLHQVPAYPGTGLYSFENCYNFPLPPGTTGDKYLTALKKALEVIDKFSPEIIGVSLGLDTHEQDPLLALCLKDPDYKKIGLNLAQLNKPVFVIFEGGYHPQTIGHAFYCFWKGLTEKKVEKHD
ncbi:MAG: histone deacetylase [Candidatus Omnitrophica bacterium]|nr:histone deacetylase [Candidatus Omnitrophota bacterium]